MEVDIGSGRMGGGWKNKESWRWMAEEGYYNQ